MATLLNMAKEARKKIKKAERLQADAVFLYIHDKPVGYLKSSINEAREATIEATTATQMVLSQLEKDSPKRRLYQSVIQKNNVFLDATQG
ncbi:MAG: hypothetical protein IJU00_12810 [Selenomonas sp.]|nr:hypothetical protein [Selenomonas sp.]